jgi:hypothetical protein
MKAAIIQDIPSPSQAEPYNLHFLVLQLTTFQERRRGLIRLYFYALMGCGERDQNRISLYMSSAEVEHGMDGELLWVTRKEPIVGYFFTYFH